MAGKNYDKEIAKWERAIIDAKNGLRYIQHRMGVKINWHDWFVKVVEQISGFCDQFVNPDSPEWQTCLNKCPLSPNFCDRNSVKYHNALQWRLLKECSKTKPRKKVIFINV